MSGFEAWLSPSGYWSRFDQVRIAQRHRDARRRRDNFLNGDCPTPWEQYLAEAESSALRAVME